MRAGELAWRLGSEGDGAEVSLLQAHTALAAHKAKADVLTREPGLVAAARFLNLLVREP